MAASDEFPRGWTVSTFVNPSSSLSIVVSQAPNISHVVTNVLVEMVSLAAYTGNINFFLEDYDLSATLINLGWVSGNASDDAPFTSGISWEGSITFPVGHRVALLANMASPASAFTAMSISGYDI